MPTTTTTTALILLSLIAGAIWATGLAMIHVWVHHRPHRGVHRPARRGRTAAAPLPPTVAVVDLPRAFRQLDPETTRRLVTTASAPTADLSVPVDPWYGQDADLGSLFAALTR